MKYRVVKWSSYSYRVEYRHNWWPFWTTATQYKSYESGPRKRERHGGFFRDIITEETVYGYHTSCFSSESEAKERIKSLKMLGVAKRNRKLNPKPQVVHTE